MREALGVISDGRVPLLLLGVTFRSVIQNEYLAVRILLYGVIEVRDRFLPATLLFATKADVVVENPGVGRRRLLERSQVVVRGLIPTSRVEIHVANRPA